MTRASLLLAILLWIPAAQADQTQPPEALAAYLDQLQMTLDHAAQRANQPTAAGTSVVGVRGSKTIPLSKQLYWKGKTGASAASPEEVKMFREAVDQARAGKESDAAAKLKDFLAKHPKSALKSDAEDLLSRLSGAPPAKP